VEEREREREEKGNVILKFLGSDSNPSLSLLLEKKNITIHEKRAHKFNMVLISSVPSSLHVYVFKEKGKGRALML
jgi:hypothetical protein